MVIARNEHVTPLSVLGAEWRCWPEDRRLGCSNRLSSCGSSGVQAAARTHACRFFVAAHWWQANAWLATWCWRHYLTIIPGIKVLISERRPSLKRQDRRNEPIGYSCATAWTGKQARAAAIFFAATGFICGSIAGFHCGARPAVESSSCVTTDRTGVTVMPTVRNLGLGDWLVVQPQHPIYLLPQAVPSASGTWL